MVLRWILIALGILHLCPLSISVSDNEYSALQSLYRTTNGEYWVWDGSGLPWDFDGNGDPCLAGWEGVVCTPDCTTAESCDILGLELPLHNLTGYLSEGLEGLSSLGALDLSYNRVRGTLPDAVTNLANLQSLNLQHMCLRGNFPVDTNMTALRFLNLMHNTFDGALPEFGDFPLLEEVDLSNNKYGYEVDYSDTPAWNRSYFIDAKCVPYLSNGFSGPIPEEFWNLTGLQSCSLRSNSLSGGLLVGGVSGVNLPQLTLLDVADNKFDGYIPSGLSYMSNIEHLDLSANNFRGSLSETISGEAVKLVYLNISKNMLNGSIPSSIGSLSGLQSLSLFGNVLFSTVPSSLLLLSSLQHLSIGRGNCIYGRLPHNIGDLSQLQFLEISGAMLNGTIPTSISKLTNLRHLNFRYNKKKEILGDDADEYCQVRDADTGLRGTLFPFWGSMINLEDLILSSNWLQGTIPGNFSLVSKLKVLNFGDNAITGVLPDLSDLGSLEQLSLESNALEGTLPSSYGNLTALAEIALGYNFLAGYIPPEWASLSDLVQLSLPENVLGGYSSIPKMIGALTKLTYLDLSNNIFVGSIPSDIGKLKNLQLFHIGSNRIGSSLPESFFNNCLDLFSLDISSNTITGSIPSSLTSLSNLELFSIDTNHFFGRIPTGITQLTKLNEVLLNNNHLEGPLPNWSRKMSRLRLFAANNNSLSGSIPKSMGELLPALSSLNLAGNKFTSSIPVSLWHSPQLSILDLSINDLDGSLPELWEDEDITQHSLTFLSLYGNKLSGHFPKSLVEHNQRLFALVIYLNQFSGPLPDYTILPYLKIFSVSKNKFSGTLPVHQGSHHDYVHNLLYFDASENELTGSVPENFGIHQNLQLLLLNDNNLDGTIPKSFSFPMMSDLRLHRNNFNGPLPAWIGECERLGNLFVNSNSFDGDLNIVLHNLRSQPLVHIDISDNKFTGSLPSGLFNMTFLETLAASKNCFSGTFPNNMCMSPSLTLLVMDALSSSSTCSSSWNSRIRFFPFFTFKDTIPECLLSMKKLQEIYLSGNGLQGTLPPMNTSFNVVQLDNNELTGGIPESYLQLTRDHLSLVRNKLDGELPDTSRVQPSSLKLKLNRLSGPIPSSYREVADIDILTGNIFYCETTKDLPHHDPEYGEYICGSDFLDYSLYFWLSLIAAVAFGLSVLWWVVRERRLVLEKSGMVDAPDSEMVGRETSEPTEHMGGRVRASMLSRLSVVVKSEKWRVFETIYRWYRTGALLSSDGSMALRTRMQSHNFEFNSFSPRDETDIIVKLEKSTDRDRIHRADFDVKLPQDIFNKYKYSSEGINSELSRFITALLILRSLCIVLSVVVVVVLIPVYMGLKRVKKYSTHDEQYSWAITAAFVSGGLVTIVLGVIWLAVCSFFFWIVCISYADYFSIMSPSPKAPTLDFNSGIHTARGTNMEPTIIFGCVVSGRVKRANRAVFAIVTNTAVVLLSTYLYLFFLVSDLSSGGKVFIQWAFSMWKMLWNTFGVPACFFAMNWLEHRNKVFVYISTLFFNNALSIFIATSLSDPSCFVDVWYPLESETVTYSGFQCTEFSPIFDRCYNYIARMFTVEFTTPSVYTYLCASQILRSFIPIFFYIYAGTLFIMPTVFVVLASCQKGSWSPFVVHYAPAILWPEELSIQDGMHLSLMRPNIVMNAMIGHVMILLTFGVFCPLLAVTISVAIFTISSMWITLVGRYVEIAFLSSKTLEYERARTFLDHTFCDVWTTLYHSRWTVIIGAASCYGFLFFDYVGDGSGVVAGFVVGSVISLFFVIVYAIAHFLQNSRLYWWMHRQFAQSTSPARKVMLRIVHSISRFGIEDNVMLAGGGSGHEAEEEDCDMGIRLTCTTTHTTVSVQNPIFATMGTENDS